MGQSLYEEHAIFKEMVEEANRLLPYDLRTIMFESEEVHKTRYAQPALYVMGCALYEMFKEEGVAFDIVAGLSIGEYAALYARGVYDFTTGLDIVEHRAHYMQEAAQAHETTMLAMRTDIFNAKKIIENEKDVYISNHNLKNQVVLAGSKDAVAAIQSKGETYGVKRMIPLNTSGAFHTPFMDAARDSFKTYLDAVAFNEPQKGLYLNRTGRAYDGGLKTHMIEQMTHTVLFAPMLEAMLSDGMNMSVEAGPGKTLSSFVKKTDRSVTTLTLENSSSFESICEKIRSENHA